ncbi:uncharacterized protein EV422DRAFT_64049 [Fimicolochytrium jonesii]|uniref:uncharacterized protein n=1 Tax=Fimicolochytrium jonesii TaxID=1396493 RepID=UPI0022FDDB49|nr:uncharacterized protein EV422DRAFT_64049 [Fimicolochytrium jonesii]KAI8820808.1 hypothetical protein EV422DRAFT_64049 [Fimicolochytrium jonesii]
MGGDKTSHHHRSGLKQQNKGFKSRHSTKGQVKAKTKGKVDVTQSVKHKHNAVSHKADRRNQAKLIQQKKRNDLVNFNRLFSGARGAPKIVAVVPLCPDVDPRQVVADLYSSLGETMPSTVGPITLNVERYKQKIQFLALNRNLLDILDGVKIADFVVFVVSAQVEVDTFGEQCLSAIKAQGVPSILSVVQHLDKCPEKQQIDIKKSLNLYMEDHFPEDSKLFNTATETEGLATLRFITQQRPKPIAWRDRHAYIVPDTVEFVPIEGDEESGTLIVTGYVRGNNLSANRLVHIPNHGDYQIKVITSAQSAAQSSDMALDVTILDQPDPAQQESLVVENSPNPLDAEQTWPTEEELREADARVEQMGGIVESEAPARKPRRVPKGTSAYQAAWIMDDEDEEEDDEDAETHRSMDVTMTDASGVSGTTVDWASMGLGHNAGADVEVEEEEEYEDLQEDDKKSSDFDDEYDEDEEKMQYDAYVDKQKQEREEKEFPDEIDTPKDPAARIRFQRYRGLKSFRTSPWDPYENLPVDYARIFQIKNFKRTRRRVFDSIDEEGIAPGTNVVLHIQAVPRAVTQRDLTRPFTLFTLLPHEQKFSVVNFVVSRNDQDQDAVKSKDPVIIQSGFRRYMVQPIYSTDTRGGNNNVHKFERFLQHGRTSVATVYAPIQFGPAPVLMWRPQEGGNRWDAEHCPPMLAQGSILDLDPCRIVSKRIILTGHPFKVHKRGAVIRYMFWSPEDINYFKPVQLVTKMGRVGHIRETLGTHGYMKCIFDAPLKGQDTVCMYLYKRVFPKWNTRLFVDAAGAKADEAVADMEM